MAVRRASVTCLAMTPPGGGQEASGIEIQDDTMNTADGDDQFEPDLDLRRESAEAIETVILSGEHQ